jgi:hypothetical protein
MPYAYQSFTSGQVLTGAQMQQVEDNIRDHKHGLAGVGVVGLGYNVSSKGGAFSVAAADHGTLFLAAGDFDISMGAAGSLGATFGAGFKNIGSGRIAIKPNGSQLIDASSYFVLAPGEMVNVYSDAIGLGTFGNSLGPKQLWDTGNIVSLTNVDITRLYPGDFGKYELTIEQMTVTANCEIRVLVSQDSGSSFIAAGYSDETTADTTFGVLTPSAIGSVQFVYGQIEFANRWAPTIPLGAARYKTVQLAGGVSGVNRTTRWPITSQLNAIRIFTTAGNFSAGRIQLWGYPRR